MVGVSSPLIYEQHLRARPMKNCLRRKLAYNKYYFQNPACPLQAPEGPPEPVDGRRHGELQQPRVPSLRRVRPGPVRQPLLLLQVPATAQPAVLETMSSILLRLNKPCNYYSRQPAAARRGGCGGVIIPQGKREREKEKAKGKL